MINSLNLKPGTSCLDVGGVSDGFEQLSKICSTVTVNLEIRQRTAGWGIIVADARSLPIRSKSVDFVYSVALLEHVDSGLERVAAEIDRISRRGFFVAVPYLYSPFEPHYLIPFFQFVPESIKRALILKLGLRIGYMDRRNYAKIELFTRRRLASIFPTAKVQVLKVYSIPISVTASKKWSST
jgi:ubiquinone/menaquinone biosynthesis C-methylase UbiE